VFDPDRDDDHGTRRFYLRLLTIVVVAVAACGALFPSVSGFSAGVDGDKSCMAISDGWHADRGQLSAAEKEIESTGFVSQPSPEQRIVIDRANAKIEWAVGPGICVPESRHRLLLSGIGLGGLLVVCGAVVVIRRRRRCGRDDEPPREQVPQPVPNLA
jgi:hypothetical protein